MMARASAFTSRGLPDRLGMFHLRTRARTLHVAAVRALAASWPCAREDGGERRAGEPPGRFELPAAVPLFGALFCFGLLAVRIATGDVKAPLIAGVLVAGILVIYAFVRRETP